MKLLYESSYVQKSNKINKEIEKAGPCRNKKLAC